MAIMQAALHRNALGLMVALFAAAASITHAQNYPVKPVRLIAPFPAGGSSDLIARILAQRLSEGFAHTKARASRSPI